MILFSARMRRSTVRRPRVRLREGAGLRRALRSAFAPACAAALAALLAAGSARAAVVTIGTQKGASTSSSRQNSSLYYLVGGGNPSSLSANPNSLNLKFSLSGNALLSYSCGRFNVGDAFAYYMTEFKQLGTTLQAGIGAAVAALPLYIFQRAQPGLYSRTGRRRRSPSPRRSRRVKRWRRRSKPGAIPTPTTSTSPRASA
jgi:hypothetical protein